MPYTEDDQIVKWLGKQIMFGREAPSDFVQDFLFDHSDAVLKLRKLFLVDVGDPGDMGFGRIGPDNAPWNTGRGSFQRVAPNTNLGTWYWRPFVGLTDAPPGMGFSGKSAQIYARTRGLALPTSTPGSLHLGTTPEGAIEPVDRIEIEADGTLNLTGIPTTYHDGAAWVRCRTADGRIRILRLE